MIRVWNFCCPLCKKGKIYSGLLTLSAECSECHASLGALDIADAPAFFAIVFVSVVVIPLALAVEFLYQPVWWIHALLWIPFSFTLTVWLIRVLKAWFVRLHYRHKILN